MQAARWLTVAAALAAAALAEDQRQDLTLLLTPEKTLDWAEIEQWMAQNGFQTEAPESAEPLDPLEPPAEQPQPPSTALEPAAEPQPEEPAELEPQWQRRPEPQPEEPAESDPRWQRRPEPQPEEPAESEPRWERRPEPQPEEPAESEPRWQRRPEPQPEEPAESEPRWQRRPEPVRIVPGPALMPGRAPPGVGGRASWPAPPPHLQPGPALVPTSEAPQPEPAPLALPLVAPQPSVPAAQMASADYQDMQLLAAPTAEQPADLLPASSAERPGDLLFRLEPIVDEVAAEPPHDTTEGPEASAHPEYHPPAEYGSPQFIVEPVQPGAHTNHHAPDSSGHDAPYHDTTERPQEHPLQPEDEQYRYPYPGGAAPGQMSPDTLAILLQRLEDRLVASEALQREQATELRAIQHRQRKQEVVQSEQKEDIRTQFDNLDHRVENLQSDLSRVTSLLEAVLGDVRAVARRQREQSGARGRAAGSSSGGSGGGDDQQLRTAVSELGQTLGQVVVSTETLKSGQRKLTSSLKLVTNQTRELSERADEFATKVTVAGGLSEMRTYLDRHRSPPPAPTAADREPLPADCSDVQMGGDARQSGIYQVRPRGAAQPFFVYCELETAGGGWAVVQHRNAGDEDFFQDWLAYKYGFGNLGSEFWLGNENIHQLTSHKLNELRVELSDFPRQRSGYDPYTGSNATASYAAFALGSETEGYSLKILDGYSGDAGDSLKYHAGMKFSTKDMDNDLWLEDSCANAHKGGWWYKGCDSSNLNGLYLSGSVPAEYEYQGAYWYDWRGPLYSLYRTRMLVRPADHSRRLQSSRKRDRNQEGSKLAAQYRSGPQTVRKNKRRRHRRRKGRRHGRSAKKAL